MRLAAIQHLVGRVVGDVVAPAARHAARRALDFCYPGVCANCEVSSDGGAVLCGDCIQKLGALAHAAFCDRCAMPLASNGAPCPYCFGNGVRPFERIIRLGVFEDPLKHLIHLAKYHRRWPLCELLADRLIDTERTKGLLTETDILVPVPLHLRRHITRGYNQADVIARRIGKVCRIPVLHAARRVRNTETQTHLSQAQRLANVRGAFALKRGARRLFGKHVVLIDDVMTTAATLRELARTLKHVAPASLSVLVLAIADRKGRGFEVI